MAVDAPKKPGRNVPTRETLTSIGDDGSRVIIHPSDVSGRFTNWRRFSALALIALYVLLPWIPIKGKPALFFDLANLRFHVFGVTLAVQDLWLGFFLITGLAFSLFFITALLGRVWCGWACPQTVFLEHVFRRIERFLEGDAIARRRLDSAPWTPNKILRRGLKHAIFVVCALLIMHILLSYFVSLPRLWGMVSHAPGEHWGAFVFIVVATGMLYFNFAFFREQLCIMICPYGRLQSALIDDDSVVIGYDENRGEPRGKIHHDETDAELGDCIACNRCVQVCTTGIDIRQGLQLECIGCSNCIDACDEVMDKVGRPRGLVRYDSFQGLAGLKRRVLRPRVVLYSVLLVIGATVAAISFSRYQPATFNVVRIQGAPYFVDEDSVRNQFIIRVINKGTVAREFSLSVTPVDADVPGLVANGWENSVAVADNDEELRPLILRVPRAAYAGEFKFRIDVTDADGDITLHREVEFIGPDLRLFREHETGAE